MSETILLIDYEPRTIHRVSEALAPLGCHVTTVKDLDSAVNACASDEPHLVILTSVLPRFKVEDAITQLRARAGLRSTPFLILMSGYGGKDRRADAERLGAQSLVAKPFSNEELTSEVRSLLTAAKTGKINTDTRNEVLDALRRTAGLQSGPGTVTSEDLFGDLLEGEGDVDQAATQQIRVQPVAPKTPDKAKEPPPPEPTRTPAPPQPFEDTGVERTVAQAIPPRQREEVRPPAGRRKDDGESVDELLSKTLSGLEISGLQKPRPKVKPEQPAAPAPEEAKAEQPAAPAREEAKAEPAEAAAPEVAPAPEPVPAEEPAEARLAEPPPEPEPEAAEKPAEAAPPETPPEPEPEAEPEVPPAEEHVEPPAAVTPTPPAARPGTGPLPSGTPFGQYELMELIATGGMAEVYKARMSGVEGFQKIVAIKRILSHLTDNDEFVTMFIDEAKLAAQLQHPNIIHIYDLGKIERSYYIAMEFIDGKDLRSILRELEENGRKMPLPLALFIVSRLAAALDYAHRKKDLQGRDMALVHRDVSPQNVLISFDGEIKLCDFGIAKAAVKASQTRVGALKGKLQYMSPEQAWGKGIDHRSDIFSLGLVLYELVTDRKGFTGDSELSILEQARTPRLPRVRDLDPNIPEEVEQVVLKALQEHPDKRYQTARDMASDLEVIQHGLRPNPTAARLASFLAELCGRERPVSEGQEPEEVEPVAIIPEKPEEVEQEQPAAAEMPKDTTPDEKPPVVMPPPAEPLPIADSQVIPPPKRFPVGLAAGIGVLVVAVAAALFLVTRDPGEDPMAAVQRAADEEVARQEALLRERLAEEMALADAEEDEEDVAPPVAVPPQPTPVPAEPAAVPSPAPATPVPEPEPTAVPEPVEPEPTPVPTAPPPTPVPSPVPTRPPLVAEVPAVQEGDLVALTSDVVAPQPVSKPQPEYPPAARRMRVGGRVILQLIVDHNGQVEDVQVLRGVRSDLDAAAVAAARNWRYRPATKDGVRVKVRITETINFTP